MLDEDKDKKKRRDDDGSESGGDPDGPNKPKGVDFKSSKYLLVVIVVGFIVALVFGMKAQFPNSDRISWSEFRDKATRGEFKEVEINSAREIVAKYSKGQVTNGKSEVPASTRRIRFPIRNLLSS